MLNPSLIVKLLEITNFTIDEDTDTTLVLLPNDVDGDSIDIDIEAMSKEWADGLKKENPNLKIEQHVFIVNRTSGHIMLRIPPLLKIWDKQGGDSYKGGGGDY